MKTIEFKIYPNKTQKQKIDSWCDGLKFVWNRGVFLIEEFNKFNAYIRYEKGYKKSEAEKKQKTAPCCPITSYNHRIRDKDEAKGVYASCPVKWVLDAYTDKILVFPVSLSEKSKALDNISNFSLLSAFSHKEHEDKPWITDIPSKFIAGNVAALATSWESFTKQVRPNTKPPKYKGKNDKVDTLVNINSKGMGVKGDKINIPKLGYTTVKGLSDRWNTEIPFSVLKITRKASGYYLQLTGEGSLKPEVIRQSKTAIAGIDPGVKRLWTDDQGNFVESPRYLEDDKQQLIKLQRKASRQKNHSDNATKKYKECKNIQKTNKRIAKLHEKIARKRKAFNHQQSTELVNKYAVIYLEDTQLTNMVRKPKALKNEEKAGYAQNGSKRKAGLNKALSDVSMGQFRMLLETKGKVNNTEIIRVKAAYSSQKCSNCGHTAPDNRLTQSNFKCVSCYFECNADQNAAINHKKFGLVLRDK